MAISGLSARTTTIRKKDTSPASSRRELPLALVMPCGAGRQVDVFGVEASTGVEAKSTSTVALMWSIGGTILSTAEAWRTITPTCDRSLPATPIVLGIKGN